MNVAPTRSWGDADFDPDQCQADDWNAVSSVLLLASLATCWTSTWLVGGLPPLFRLALLRRPRSSAANGHLKRLGGKGKPWVSRA